MTEVEGSLFGIYTDFTMVQIIVVMTSCAFSDDLNLNVRGN